MGLEKYIDHTLLRADATIDDIFLLCQEAKEYQFMSVCVNPCYVPFAKSYLENSGVKVCTVIGFPLGNNLIRTKIDEINQAINMGADEVDMVMNIGMFKAHQFDYIKEELLLAREASRGHVLKIIIETCLLDDEEKRIAASMVKDSGADFVKTSTGFSKGGATIEDVKLLREVVGAEMGVKASGGIRTHEDLINMIEAGANRIGTSAGSKII